MRILNCTSLNQQGQTIKLDNTEYVDIRDTFFQESGQTNIKLEMADLIVRNSNFTQSSTGYMVHGVDSFITFEGVYMFNSSNIQQVGHGLYCFSCRSVKISQSTFVNMTSKLGGAIYLEDISGVSEVSHSYF